ncbi:helix-turn-helix domain-containing protein, partial [Cobetia sp. Dlab-2-AX]|uniref:helix-turn-helix domain-containing protein n=1 Tax=Cobetia sp. Dlab-2-AX TaxID=2954488 RepID=UPI0025B7881A
MEYRQLTQTQRYQIHARYDLGMSQRQTGRELNLHSSTISREIRRNATANGYDPEQAQILSDHRRRTANK